MTIEMEVLTEAYSIIKQYVPTKDRQECANNLISAMVDMLSDDQLDELGESDAGLGKALSEYLAEAEPDSDEQYDE